MTLAAPKVSAASPVNGCVDCFAQSIPRGLSAVGVTEPGMLVGDGVGLTAGVGDTLAVPLAGTAPGLVSPPAHAATLRASEAAIAMEVALRVVLMCLSPWVTARATPGRAAAFLIGLFMVRLDGVGKIWQQLPFSSGAVRLMRRGRVGGCRGQRGRDRTAVTRSLALGVRGAELLECDDLQMLARLGRAPGGEGDPAPGRQFSARGVPGDNDHVQVGAGGG